LYIRTWSINAPTSRGDGSEKSLGWIAPITSMP